MLYIKNIRKKAIQHAIVMLIIASVIVPLLITDLWIELYHRTCFPLCGIPYVKREDYIRVMDRSKLQYLNWYQKIFCMYCGYGNGVIRYWGKIAGETEKYWCGIQHNTKDGFVLESHQKDFAKYGNEKEFKEKYCKLQK